MKWVGKNKKRQEKYGDALEKIKKGVEANTTALDMQLIGETVANIELLGFASGVQNGVAMAIRNGQDSASALKTAIASQARRYQDYYEPLDREEAAALLKYYREKAKPEYYLDALSGDFANLDIDKYVNNLYDNSIFTSPEKLEAAVAEKGFSAVKSDPVNQLMNALLMTYAKMGLSGGMGGRRPTGGNPGANDMAEGQGYLSGCKLYHETHLRNRASLFPEGCHHVQLLLNPQGCDGEGRSQQLRVQGTCQTQGSL